MAASVMASTLMIELFKVSQPVESFSQQHSTGLQVVPDEELLCTTFCNAGSHGLAFSCRLEFVQTPLGQGVMQ